MSPNLSNLPTCPSHHLLISLARQEPRPPIRLSTNELVGYYGASGLVPPTINDCRLQGATLPYSALSNRSSLKGLLVAFNKL